MNFEIRIYNPSFGKAKLNYFDYAGSVLCCFRRFNQRMHTKLILIDDAVGITGGRNYQDDYYDWDAEYNFRDRDVLVAGPASREMATNFDAFWNARRSVPVERLNDVGRKLLKEGVPAMPPDDFLRPERVAAMSAEADDEERVRERLAQLAMPVGAVKYVADLPQKHRRKRPDGAAPAVPELKTLIEGAQSEVLMQTPYLVMSDAAQDLFRALHQRKLAAEVIVSTNSLAATDNAVVYSMSFKYKRRYLREFGFRIYEYKPFPEDAPVDYAALMPDGPPLAMEDEQVFSRPVRFARPVRIADRAETAGETTRRLQRTESRPSFLSSGAATEPLPLKRAGVRIGLHAKSMVIDNRIGVIGTHNFDPRSENYNTESAVVIDDAGLRAGAGRQHPPRHLAGEFLGDRAARQTAGVVGAGLQPGQGVRGAAAVRPLALALCHQLRVQARPGLPGAGAAERSRFPSLLRGGRRFPRGQRRARNGCIRGC